MKTLIRGTCWLFLTAAGIGERLTVRLLIVPVNALFSWANSDGKTLRQAYRSVREDL